MAAIEAIADLPPAHARGLLDDVTERVLGLRPRGLEMCLAQADSAAMTRFSGIAVLDRQHAVAGRREP